MMTSFIMTHSGPQINPEECGAPILCVFYGRKTSLTSGIIFAYLGLLFLIFLVAVYQNIKGKLKLKILQ